MEVTITPASILTLLVVSVFIIGILFKSYILYSREQVYRNKARISKIAKFLHENDEPRGMANLGSGVLHPRISLKTQFRTQWIVTIALFSDEHVSDPVVIFSRQLDIYEAAISAIDTVYATSDRRMKIKQAVWESLSLSIRYYGKHYLPKLSYTIDIKLSEAISARLDIGPYQRYTIRVRTMRNISAISSKKKL